MILPVINIDLMTTLPWLQVDWNQISHLLPLTDMSPHWRYICMRNPNYRWRVTWIPYAPSNENDTKLHFIVQAVYWPKKSYPYIYHNKVIYSWQLTYTKCTTDHSHLTRNWVSSDLPQHIKEIKWEVWSLILIYLLTSDPSIT